jgi:CheY-specific phosphatase CheX
VCVTRTEQDILLSNNTSLLVRKVREVFKDMVDADLHILSKPQPRDRRGAKKHGMVVLSHFCGMIQGDFILFTDEETAASLAGIPVAAVAYEVLTAQREMYAGLMCEALNAIVCQSITDLEEMFGALTILPPSWIFGEYYSADYISGVGYLSGRYGDITCSLSLNMVSLQIIDNLMRGKVQ